jgi:polyhydroxybutyrate depolymerase
MNRARVAVLSGMLAVVVACGSDDGKGSGSEAVGGSVGSGGEAVDSSSSGGDAGTSTTSANAGGDTSTTGIGGEVGEGGSGSGGKLGEGGAAGATSNTSPGCAVTGSATGVQELTITAASTDRQYVLSVPANYAPGTPLPLVFAWHGLGGDGPMARMYFRVEQAAGSAAIFVYPTGLPNEDDQTGWDLAEDGIDVALFDSLLEEVSAAYCVDLNRVYATGHSFGGMMTNALGCYRAGVLRGIAPVAGMPPFWGGGSTCDKPIAAWIAHGENDGTVDFAEGGVATRDLWLGTNGCAATSAAVEPSPCIAYDGCTDRHPVHWCVHQEDHNWPAFAGEGVWGFFASLD